MPFQLLEVSTFLDLRRFLHFQNALLHLCSPHISWCFSSIRTLGSHWVSPDNSGDSSHLSTHNSTIMAMFILLCKLILSQACGIKTWTYLGREFISSLSKGLRSCVLYRYTHWVCSQWLPGSSEKHYAVIKLTEQMLWATAWETYNLISNFLVSLPGLWFLPVHTHVWGNTACLVMEPKWNFSFVFN